MGAPDDQHALPEALARTEAERDEAVLREGQLLSSGMKALARANAAEQDARYYRSLHVAAEAENTRLKETVETARAALTWIADQMPATCEMSIVHDITFHARSVLATIPPKENPDA